MVVANLLGALEGPEALIILAVVLLLFGGTKLPQLARSLGQAKNEFRQAQNDAPPADRGPVAAAPEPAESEMVTVSRAELDQLRRAATLERTD